MPNFVKTSWIGRKLEQVAGRVVWWVAARRFVGKQLVVVSGENATEVWRGRVIGVVNPVWHDPELRVLGAHEEMRFGDVSARDTTWSEAAGAFIHKYI